MSRSLNAKKTCVLVKQLPLFWTTHREINRDIYECGYAESLLRDRSSNRGSAFLHKNIPLFDCGIWHHQIRHAKSDWWCELYLEKPKRPLLEGM